MICGCKNFGRDVFFGGEDGVSTMNPTWCARDLYIVTVLPGKAEEDPHVIHVSFLFSVGCLIPNHFVVLENGLKNGLLQVPVHHLSDPADENISEFHQEKEKWCKKSHQCGINERPVLQGKCSARKPCALNLAKRETFKRLTNTPLPLKLLGCPVWS